MKNSSLVYSTDPNKEPCTVCGKVECECPPEKNDPLAGQTAHLRIERKGRKGKSVTLVENLTVHPLKMAELGKTLKQKLGTGGTVKNGRIEIQGEHRQHIAEILHGMNVKTKNIGH